LKTRPSLAIVAAITAITALARCGGSSTTQQTPTLPTVTAPTPTPPPPAPVGIVLPAGMVCDPTPPPLLKLKVSMWRQHGEGWILQADPIVPNVDHFCERAGFGNWKFCFTRQEYSPERGACDFLVVGQALDTGRWGPTWFVDGKPCDGKAACVNGPDNQFKAIARGPGHYEACISPLAKVYDGDTPYPGERCGSVDVP
jgi:hypothetical protein